MDANAPDKNTTRPTADTRAAEEAEMSKQGQADRLPTDEEARAAERNELTDDVIEHEEEMLERGAHQQGEGRI